MAKHSHGRDEDLLSEAQRAAIGGASRFAFVLLFAIVALLGAFVAWATHANLPEVIRGDGRVIPSAQNKVVQNQEGGLVSEILVREGDIVEPGDVLLRVDNSTALAGLSSKRSRYLSLISRAARLTAEAREAEEIDFPQEVLDADPRLAENQQAEFETNREILNSELAILRSQKDQKLSDLESLNQRVTNLTNQLNSIDEEVSYAEPLVNSGALSRVEYLRMQRDADRIRGELGEARSQIPGVRAQIAEIDQKIKARRSDKQAEARSKLNEVLAEAAVLKEELEADVDRVARTEVTSPVRGEIKEVYVTTIGGVIKPGEDLVEIVPLDDTLLVEARISPSDRAGLRPGLDAIVKVSAYDFSIYGGLEAELLGISADTIEDEDNRTDEEYFRIRVRTDKNYLGNDPEENLIRPGMTAQVDILTGEKTVWEYLMKPILKAKNEALRER